MNERQIHDNALTRLHSLRPLFNEGTELAREQIVAHERVVRIVRPARAKPERKKKDAPIDSAERPKRGRRKAVVADEPAVSEGSGTADKAGET